MAYLENMYFLNEVSVEDISVPHGAVKCFRLKFSQAIAPKTNTVSYYDFNTGILVKAENTAQGSIQNYGQLLHTVQLVDTNIPVSRSNEDSNFSLVLIGVFIGIVVASIILGVVFKKTKADKK